MATPTVCNPDLYPDPVRPIATEVIVPALDTTAVPPAATNGWNPYPSVDPTLTIIPPRGTSLTLISLLEL